MRVLRVTHRWLGLVLALPLAIQGLSGAILSVEPALTGWGARAGVLESPGRVVAGAQAVAPDGMRPARLSPPEAAGDPALVRLVPSAGPRGPGLVVRVDPASGVALGAPEPTAGFMDWTKRLHETWLIPQLGGRQLSGTFGAGLVLLVLIGIPLWWPAGQGWASGYTVPRRARGALLQRRLHGAMGGWLTILMLITGVTGITQGFPQTTRAVLGLPAGGPGGGGPRGPGAAPRPAAAALDLDAGWRLAQSAAPGLALRLVILPNGGGDPVRFVLGPVGQDGATTATTVLVDAAGTRVVSVQRPDGVSAAESTMRVLRDLHVGDGFGPVYRGVMAVAGVLLPAFGVTGFLLWLLKRRNRRRLARSRVDAVAAE